MSSRTAKEDGSVLIENGEASGRRRGLENVWLDKENGKGKWVEVKPVGCDIASSGMEWLFQAELLVHLPRVPKRHSDVRTMVHMFFPSDASLIRFQ